MLFADPKSSDERHNVAGACLRQLKLDLPAVIDEQDNRIERAYTAWPDRLYVINREGRVAYKSAPGPFGFKVDDMAKALRAELAR